MYLKQKTLRFAKNHTKMKKIITSIAALMLVASVSFAQDAAKTTGTTKTTSKTATKTAAKGDKTATKSTKKTATKTTTDTKAAK